MLVSTQALPMTSSKEIQCPHCEKMFKIDESNYLAIQSQVRDHLFEEQLKNGIATEVKLVEQKLINEHSKDINEKDTSIQKLENKISTFDKDKKLAIAEVEKSTKREIYELKSKLESLEKNNDVNQRLAIQGALSPLQKKINNLESSLEKKELEVKVFEKSLIEKHTIEKQGLNDQIASLRDYKSKLSVKLVGENLEQHCLTEFERCLRPILPKATFTKDNDACKGETKGDYIFRDYDNNGTEIVSIMFDMKDECDLTTTKKKNEDFLTKLDKDRNKKGCEYAVLVSTLEADSELYNSGIVGKQHIYTKMCVVRPQCFITIINFLREKGMESLEAKTELINQKAKNLDVTNFENDLEALKIASGRNLDLGLKGIQKAIDRQHKIISQAEDTITDLMKTASRNFKLLNDKLQGVTVKKLVSKNPTMKAKFLELKNNI